MARIKILWNFEIQWTFYTNKKTGFDSHKLRIKDLRDCKHDYVNNSQIDNEREGKILRRPCLTTGKTVDHDCESDAHNSWHI